MTTTTPSSLRSEAPLIIVFLLVFIGLIPFLPRETICGALILFFVFGAYTEMRPLTNKKPDQGGRPLPQRLFSETDFVVPTCVPITLGWTYLQMTTDGQTFTQRILGIIGCLVVLGMLWFFVRKKLSDTRRISISLILSICTFATLYQLSIQLTWAYDFQKGFNKMVTEQQSEQNKE